MVKEDYESVWTVGKLILNAFIQKAELGGKILQFGNTNATRAVCYIICFKSIKFETHTQCTTGDKIWFEVKSNWL